MHNMILKVHLKKIVHVLNLERQLELLKEFHNDNRGGLLISVTAKITDKDYERYRHLDINWSIPPITKDDLPEDFSPMAVKTVDMFRRKTIDLPFECLILFDYVTGNIISCNFSDKNSDDKVETIVYPNLLKTMHIASLHNHPKQFLSPPSDENFQMLGLEFEEFELISAPNEVWILESREMVFNDEIIDEIREKANGYFNFVYEDAFFDCEKNYQFLDKINKGYGDFLLEYLNNEFNNIKLTRRYLNE